MTPILYYQFKTKKLGIFTNLDMKYYTYYPYIKKINEAKS